MAFALAVDAWNLADDRRVMGRYVRRVLADWHDEKNIDVTLVVRSAAQVAALSTEFVYRCEIGLRRQVDAVWYPWNALRFSPRGARSVVTFHDAFAFTYPHREFVARWREQSPIRRAMRVADRRLTDSQWSADELARVFHLDRALFSVVYPVPDPFWCAVAPDREDPFVLVVGGPEPRKNLATLFTAFNDPRLRAISLVVAGRLSASDEAGLAQSLFRYERVQPADAELRALYSGALAVAVPSLAEGYGLMSVEAMACGAAVIASDAAALPEACDGAALLVPPTDAGAWSEALLRVAGDERLRAEMRERSRARAARIDRHAPARQILEICQAP